MDRKRVKHSSIAWENSAPVHALTLVPALALVHALAHALALALSLGLKFRIV